MSGQNLENINVLIDSKLDKTGFNAAEKSSSKMSKTVNKQIDAMNAGLKKLGKIAAAAFSIKAMNDSLKAYDYQIQQEKKLEVVMKQRMNANDAMVDSIKKMTAAQQGIGVIGDEVQMAGVQQLATFVSEQKALEALIPAMNNLAAQQKGVNASGEDMVNIGNMIGKVLQGQVGALTRVGITFTKAEEEMLKFGTETERAAVLAQVITNNVGEMNKALANTSAGRVQQMKNAWGDLAETFGKVLSPLRDLFVPILSKAIALLDSFLQKMAVVTQSFVNFTAGVFGLELPGIESIATGASAASDAVDSLTGSTQKAAKAAKGLGGFDKLNVLNQDAGSGAGNIAGLKAEEKLTESITKQEEQSTQSLNMQSKILDTIKGALSAIKNSWAGVFDGLSAFKSIIPSLQSDFLRIGNVFLDAFKIAEDAGKYLLLDLLPSLTKSFIDNFSAPIANLVKNTMSVIANLFEENLSQLGNTFYNYLIPGIDKIKNAIIDVMPAWAQNFDTLYNGVVIPFVQNLGSAFINVFYNALNVIIPIIADITAGAITLFTDLQTKAVNVMQNLNNNVILPAIEYTKQIINDGLNLIKDFWDKWGKDILDGVVRYFTNIFTALQRFCNELIIPVLKTALDTLKKLWDNNLKGLLESLLNFIGKVGTGWSEMIDAFQPVITWLQDKLLPIWKNVFNACVLIIGAFFAVVSDVLKWIVDLCSGIVDFLVGVFTGNWQKAWQGIADIFVGIWDGLKAVFSNFFNFFIDGLNKMIRGINDLISFKMPDWMGGKEFSVGKIPEIPKLAKGGVVNSETLATIGEAGKEAVIPLSDSSIFKEFGRNIAAELNNVPRGTISQGPVILELDGFEIARALLPNLEQEKVRLGLSY